MKLSTNDIPAVTSKGVKSVSNFTINASAQAFSILSSGLYKNPVKAIIRELSTNAIDSHVEAGNENKFDVEIPTRYSPVFRIRDYGTGLAKEDVIGLYSTYFGSTKTDSNDQIGALGLGSKSPLGYTNSFSVVSYFNGMKYNFSIFIGEDGFPNIALTGENPCEEYNGLEIIIPAKNDIYKWEEEAKNVYKYFDTLPNFIGSDVNITPVQYKHEYDNIKVKANTNYATPHNLVQGGIAYPFSFDDIEIDSDIKDMINNLKFDIFCEIGEVSFLPNREEISYDVRTIATIQKNVANFAKNIRKNIKAEIAAISVDNSFDEIQSVIHDLSNSYSRLITADKKLLKKLEKKVKAVSKNGFIVLDTSPYSFGVKYDIKLIGDKLNEVSYAIKSTPLKRANRYTSVLTVSPVFWINDTGKRVLSKFKGQIKRVNNFLVADLQGNTVEDMKDFICDQFNVSEEEICLISEHVFQETAAQKAKKGVYVKTWKSDGGWFRDVDEAQPRAIDNPLVWVENVSNCPIGFHGEIIGDSYNSKNKFEKIAHKFVTPKVHGVKSKDVVAVKKLEGWIHINDYLEALIKEKSMGSSDSCFNGFIEQRDNMRDIMRLSDRLNSDDYAKIDNKEVVAILQIAQEESRGSYRNEGGSAFINNITTQLGAEIVEKYIDKKSKEVYNTQSKHEEDFFALIKDKYDYLEMFYRIVEYNRSDERKEKLINLINLTYKEV